MIKKFSSVLGLLIVTQILLAKPIITKIKEPFEQQVFMLESALAPTTQGAVATTWAKAKKERNGAVQYMLMCPTLQKTNLANLISLNWVTGVSSPWISGYKIIPGGKKENALEFIIQYQLATSSGSAGTQTDYIQVAPVTPQPRSSQQWCITTLSENTRYK